MRTDAALLIFDAGTGLQAVQACHALPKNLPIVFFFTHFHLDHIIGLPAFKPLYESGRKIKFRGPADGNASLTAFLSGIFTQPYWPVPLQKAGADMAFDAIKFASGGCSEPGIDISWHPVPHPSPCLAYKLSIAGSNLVLAVDCEHSQSGENSGFNTFCRNADTLIHDAHFDTHEYDNHRNWGHSTWQAAAQIARASHVRRLILAHHAPSRTDTELESILLQAKSLFHNTELACEGLCVPVHP